MSSEKTSAELVREYLDSLRSVRGTSAHTLAAYSGDLKEFGGFLKSIGIDDWEKAKVGQVREYAAHAMGRGLGPASLARKLSAIRAFFRHGCRVGWFKNNPALGVRGPNRSRGRPLPKALDEAEILRLVRGALALPKGRYGARTLRVWALVELLYGSGLRAGEALSLNWDDVDQVQGFVKVQGKGGKQRMVPFGRKAGEALAAYRRACGETAAGGPVFLGRTGRLSQRQLTKDFAKLAKSPGLGKRVTAHMLRHSFATHMLDRGADLRVVQELLGHSRLATTEIYTRVTVRRLKNIYAKAHPRA